MEILSQIAKELPAIVAIIVVVFIFDRRLSAIADKFLEFAKHREERLEETVNRSSSVIEKSSVLYGQIIEVIRQLKKR